MSETDKEFVHKFMKEAFKDFLNKEPLEEDQKPLTIKLPDWVKTGLYKGGSEIKLDPIDVPLSFYDLDTSGLDVVIPTSFYKLNHPDYPEFTAEHNRRVVENNKRLKEWEEELIKKRKLIEERHKQSMERMNPLSPRNIGGTCVALGII